MRRLAPGCVFHLTGHERYPAGDNAFKPLWIEHEARNNVDAPIAAADADGWIEPGTYRNRFACVRDAVAIVPRAIALPHAHTALGPQAALVVGMAEALARLNSGSRFTPRIVTKVLVDFIENDRHHSAVRAPHVFSRREAPANWYRIDESEKRTQLCSTLAGPQWRI